MVAFSAIGKESFEAANQGDVAGRVARKVWLGAKAALLFFPLYMMTMTSESRIFGKVFGGKVSSIPGFILVDPLKEEVLFRGLLQPTLIACVSSLVEDEQRSKAIAIAITAAYFGSFPETLRGVVSGAILGGMLGWLREETRAPASSPKIWRPVEALIAPLTASVICRALRFLPIDAVERGLFRVGIAIRSRLPDR